MKEITDQQTFDRSISPAYTRYMEMIERAKAVPKRQDTTCRRCQRYSCEELIKDDNGKAVFDPENRFRFIKDDEGVIYDREIVARCIADCEYRNNPVKIDSPLFKEAHKKKPRRKHRGNHSRKTKCIPATN